MRHRLLPFIGLLLVVATGSVLAQGAPATTATTPTAAPTLETIEERKRAAEADPSLDEALKPKVTELYAQALEARQSADRVRTQMAELKARVDASAERLETIHRELAAAPEDLSVLARGDWSPEEMDGMIREEEARLSAAQEAIKTQDQVLADLLNNSKTLVEAIADRSTSLAQIERDLQIAPPPGEQAAFTQARRTALEARASLRQAEIELFKLKLANDDPLAALAITERDLARAQADRLSTRIEALRAINQQRREQEAAQALAQAEEAKAQAATLPKAVRALADANVKLSGELAKVTRQQNQVTELLGAASQRVEQIRADFEATRQLVEVVGATEAVGRMLRKRRTELPSLPGYRSAASQRRDEINSAMDRQIDLAEQRREVADLAAEINRILGSVSEPLSAAERRNIEAETKKLLEIQRDTLAELHRVYGRYASALTALDRSERELVAEAEEFLAFIDEQLMWIPSGEPIHKAIMASSPAALALLFSVEGWSETLGDLVSAVARQPGQVVFAVLIVMALFAARPIAVRRIDEIAPKTRRIRTDSFGLTLATAFYTILLAAAWPAILLLAGSRLLALPDAHAYTVAVSTGFMAAGLVLFTSGLLLQICRRNGLAERHFRWPEPVRSDLSQNLRWLMPLAAILLFLVMATSIAAVQPAEAGLGRPAFLVLVVAVGVFAWRMFRRGGGLDTAVIAHAPAWIRELRFLWLPLLVAVPLAVGCISGLGYHYTALQLDQRIGLTGSFFILLIIARDLLLRWLYVTERRLRFEDALKRREEARAQRAKEDSQAEPATAELLTVEEPEVDFDQLSEQARRLLRTGLLFGGIIGVATIWADLLPALGVLDEVELPFTKTAMVDGVANVVPATLADLGIGLLILVLTIVAAKNLPGVLEITVLQRLPMDPGGRYAVTTLAQYLIVAIGIVAAFSTIGTDWSKLQWLIAALGVGLGFGLQEIVANFVSGIILLFERPIRVGDIVTLGDTSGVVSRIRIRATTIRNWDKQELIVPNKEFITGRLLNWSLTDKTNRIVIPVGVDYGTDVKLAMRLLAEAAEEHPLVLDDPKPLITFEGFGDNSLTLILRCFLPNMDNRLSTISDLHEAIHAKYGDHGINISYPQRDIHVDSRAPLEVRLVRKEAAPRTSGSDPSHH